MPRHPKTKAAAPLISPPASPTAALTRRQHLWLLAVLLIALTLRGAYLWGQARNSPLFNYPQMDGLVHHQWAQRIAAGEGMEPRPYLRAPLYYYLLALLYKLGGPSVALARVAGALLGTLSCYLIARLGAALGGFRVGLLAGLLAAVYWPLIYFDAELLTVGLEVFLNVLLLLALLAAGRRAGWWYVVLAGAVWGLSAITRPNVLALAPVFWLWLAWTAQPAGWRRRILRPLLATAALAVVVAPVTLRNYFVGHEAVLIASTGGINFYIGNNPHSTGYLAVVPEARPTWNEWLIDIKAIPERELGHAVTDQEASAYWSNRAWQWIRSDPGAWLKHTFHKLRLFWSPQEIPNNQPIGFLARFAPVAVVFWFGFPVLACLALPGALCLRRGNRRAWFVPLAFVLVYMATVVAFFCPARFRIPVVPVLLVAAAAGVLQLVDWFRARRLGPPLGYVAIGVLTAAFVATNPPPRDAFNQLAEAEGHFALGRHFATLPPDGPGDFEQAAEAYRRAVAVDPAAHRRVALARVLYTLNERAAAGEQFRLAVTEHPDDVAALRDYAALLLEEGDLAGAVQQLRVALSRAPQDTDLRQRLSDAEYNAAVALLQQGRTEDAARLLAGLLQRDPTYARAWQNMGVVYARQGALDRAIEAFRRALACDPRLTESAVNLARALRLKGRYAEARDVLTRAQTTVPGDAQILTALATLLATAPDDAVRDGARAVELAERAARLSPQPSLPLFEALATAHAEAGRFDEALDFATRARDLAASAKATTWHERFNRLCTLFAQRQPYHETAPQP